ncbi:MAG: phosphoenolpyruvate--protein phosphotransferase [Ktedonobacterales bacterium]
MEPAQPNHVGAATPAAANNTPSTADDNAEAGSLRWEPVYLAGIGVSRGIAIGPALLFQPETDTAVLVAEGRRQPANTETEKERLRTAIKEAITELRDLTQQVAREIGKSEGDIFEAQAAVLEDPTIIESASELIDHEGASAETALRAVADEQAALLAALPDPIWQARANDVRDAVQRPINYLRPKSQRRPSLADQLAQVDEPVIVVANDLMPSDTVQMRIEKVSAIALASGNATAHAAILARALGIPAVMGLGSLLLESTHEWDVLVVDGATGQVIVRPPEKELEHAQWLTYQQRSERQEANAHSTQWRLRPGQTSDGHGVPLFANVGTVAEAEAAAKMGAEGIGLLRTEFLFSDQSTFPDEEGQAALYETIISMFAGSLDAGSRPIIIRTLDVGSDKPLPSLESYVRDLPNEPNPALGVRGIRLQLLAQELLTTQLRAVLRAGRKTQASVRIMLPMVSTLEEIQETRRLLVKARAELAISATVPLGIMVETPAAVLAVSAMAQEASFLSIGTNDLTQYIMAADRTSPVLTRLCQPTQPPVLRAISAIVEGAHGAGRHVGVCGEMAGDPRLAQLLVGLGVDELSMAPASIPGVKQALAGRSLSELRALAADVLRASSITEVEQKMIVAFS